MSCLGDGNTKYKPTWAVETNYYMDLGFLPENMQYFSISGRAGWYGKKGTDTEPLPFNPANNVFNTAVEFNSEPIRLTLDASKAIMGREVQPLRRRLGGLSLLAEQVRPRSQRRLGCLLRYHRRRHPSETEPAPKSPLYAGVTVKF